MPATRYLWLRFVERIIVAIGGVISIIMGGWLYSLGIDQGDASFEVGKFIVRGQGPGIVFAGGGVFVLWFCLRTPVTVKIIATDLESGSTSHTLITLSQTVDPPPAEKTSPPGTSPGKSSESSEESSPN